MTNFIMLINIVKRQRQSFTKIPIFSSEFLANSDFPHELPSRSFANRHKAIY